MQKTPAVSQTPRSGALPVLLPVLLRALSRALSRALLLTSDPEPTFVMRAMVFARAAVMP